MKTWGVLKVKLPRRGHSGIETPSKRPLWYFHPNGDRSGAVILRALMAHAYAFANEREFMGICKTGGKADRVRECLHGLGLSGVLNVSCPPNFNRSLYLEEKSYGEKLNFAPREELRYELMTLQWLSHIKSLRHKGSRTTGEGNTYEKFPSGTSESGSRHIYQNVVVHVRHGDVSPCSKYKYDRYLPNSYYLQLLDQHPLLRNATLGTVTIFSESRTMEPFDDFTARGYKMSLDTNLSDVWRAFASADLMIASRSTFSYSPAMFNDGIVILPPIETNKFYNQFPHIIYQNWSQEELQSMYNQTDRLAEVYCQGV